MSTNLGIGVIGVGGFGAEFGFLITKMPGVDLLYGCRRNRVALEAAAQTFKFPEGTTLTTDYREVLRDDAVGAVMIMTGPRGHSQIAIEALRAGKHVASAVPMSTSVADTREIVRLVEESGGKLIYHVLETIPLTFNGLEFVRRHRDGEFGPIHSGRTWHRQQMDQSDWDSDWYNVEGYDYLSHVLSLLTSVFGPVQAVQCINTGQELDDTYRGTKRFTRAKFLFQFRFRDGNVFSADRDYWQVGQAYSEGFWIEGKAGSYEVVDDDNCRIHRAGNDPAERITLDAEVGKELLPAELQGLGSDVIDDSTPSAVQGSGHGGAHPHMVARMARVLRGDADPHTDWGLPVVDHLHAGNWVMVGEACRRSLLEDNGWVVVEPFG